MLDIERDFFARAMIGKDAKLGEMLADGIKKLECYDTLSILPLKIVFSYMRLLGMIKEETIDYLRPLFRFSAWDAQEYFPDRIKYLPHGWSYRNDLGNYTAMTINPLELKPFVMAVLRSDDNIRNFLCLDSFEELISSANIYGVNDTFIRMVASSSEAAPYKKDALVVNNLCFFFWQNEQEHVNDIVLCVEPLLYLQIKWNKEPDNVIYHGMSGQILRYGEHLYFPIKNASAYLHWEVQTGKTEILQSIRIIGCRRNENLVYVNYQTEKICYEDHGAEHDICDYNAQYGYVAHDDYILARPSLFEINSMPFHITYDGKNSEATPQEKANSFWRTFLFWNTKVHPGIYGDLKDAMLALRVKALTYDCTLSIENMEKVINLIRDNKKWQGGKMYPILGILKTLRKAGINPQEDISREIYNLVEFAQKVMKFPRESCVFPPIFYYIVYRLSKEKGFAKELRDNPDRLFQSDIVSEEEHERIQKDIIEQTGIDKSDIAKKYGAGIDNIGLFDVSGRKIKALIISKQKGFLENTQVICKNPERKYRGSLFYDVLKDKYVIDWPEANDELKEVICRVYNHDEDEVIFSGPDNHKTEGIGPFEE